jgi:2-aminoadipate transaminase
MNTTFTSPAAGLSSMAQRTTEPPISWLMKTALERPGLISLAAGFTDNTSLPREEVLELIQQILGAPSSGQAALQYGSTAGDVTLRSLTADHFGRLERAAGIAQQQPSVEETVITTGSQQLLYLITEALCDPGDIVLVEDPTYFVYLGILQSRGVRPFGITCDAEGMLPESLRQTLVFLKERGEIERVKMLYGVTYFQNPSGRTTSWKRKQELVGILDEFEDSAGHPIYFLEDAAYRELRFTGADIPSARSLSRNVLYAGTFSKPFASGARLGFGFLPEPVRTAVLRLKGNHDFGSPNFLQQLLRLAFEKGVYQRHLGTIARRYSEKAAVMQKALAGILQHKAQWEIPQGGLYFWVRFPPDLNLSAGSRFFQRALDAGVLYVPGSLCYCEDPRRPIPQNEMRLSFGGTAIANIGTGIEHLGEAVRVLESR